MSLVSASPAWLSGQSGVQYSSLSGASGSLAYRMADEALNVFGLPLTQRQKPRDEKEQIERGTVNFGIRTAVSKALPYAVSIYAGSDVINESGARALGFKPDEAWIRRYNLYNQHGPGSWVGVKPAAELTREAMITAGKENYRAYLEAFRNIRNGQSGAVAGRIAKSIPSHLRYAVHGNLVRDWSKFRATGQSFLGAMLNLVTIACAGVGALWDGQDAYRKSRNAGLNEGKAMTNGLMAGLKKLGTYAVSYYGGALLFTHVLGALAIPTFAPAVLGAVAATKAARIGCNVARAGLGVLAAATGGTFFGNKFKQGFDKVFGDDRVRKPELRS